jgi:hypothetical protein
MAAEMAAARLGLPAWGVAALIFAVAVAAPTAAPTAARRVPDPAYHLSSQPPSWTACYRVDARIRPLSVLTGAYDVGEAHLTVQSGQDHNHGYSLLIGSDPRIAPQRINRWGYFSELEGRGDVQVFGVMTAAAVSPTEEASPATAKAPYGRQLFKVIQSTIGGDRATASVRDMALSDRLTFRDLDAVMAQVPHPTVSPAVPLPVGTDPGFLFALASLMRENVEAWHRTRRPAAAACRPYVFANKLYTIATRSSRAVERTVIDGREFRDVIDSEFEVRAAAKRKGDRFRLVYGASGSLREVPVYVEYRPSMWFEASVVLVDLVR